MMFPHYLNIMLGLGTFLCELKSECAWRELLVEKLEVVMVH